METVDVMDDLTELLNDEQRAAVNFFEGPLLVLAGAGSGKTRVVTLRMIKLLEAGVPPSAILGITFTNKAAQEMKERVMKLTHQHLHVSTFHSLGARILRQSIHVLGYHRDFVIYDEEDVDKLLKIILSELKITDKKLDSKVFKHLISHAKNAMQLPDDVINVEKGASVAEIAFPQVYALYQRKLQEYNAVDFDDLLLLPVRIFREHPDVLDYYQRGWHFLLIDEYQDTNAAQYQLVKLLVERSGNIFVVGDPDQSIYSWRGANVNNILNFEKDFPGAKIIRLEQNYRSHTNILNAANALITHNQKRYEKNLWSNLGAGEKIKVMQTHNDREEAEKILKYVLMHRSEHHIPLSQMVVFYRTNFQSRIFEDILLAHRIPYTIVGGISFYQRREIKDVLSYLRMVHSGNDYLAFSRSINIPKRGLGDATLEKIRLAAAEASLSIFEFCIHLVEGREKSVKLNARQKEGLTNYVEIIRELRQRAVKGSLVELIEEAINACNYIDILKEDPESYDDRKQNVSELVAKALEWQSLNAEGNLSQFLEELSLKSSLDESAEARDRLNLMTIHNGKGLEFPVVFMAGMEEDLFPHLNSKEDGYRMEEERRLCYVGITRAKAYLYLTHAMQRFLWGGLRFMHASRFLKEIPGEYVEKIALPYKPGYKIRQQPTEFNEDFIDDIDQTKETYVQPKMKKFEISEEVFAEGDAVFHQDFGIGLISRVYQGSVGLTYEVHFSKDNSTRSLVAKFAPLTRI